MRPKLHGKVIFVFSDPGGAKPCLSLIEENNLYDALAFSDRQYSFYSDFQTSVNILGGDFEQLVNDINPNLIFTGTSYTSDIEKSFIEIARKKGILCFSFIDHWTNISKRFETVAGEILLPDEVWVIDERAKMLAIDQGIIKEKLRITGNPYHDRLKLWNPVVNKCTFFNQLGLTQINRKILVFAPDPLSNIRGKELYGFDELSATSLLVELFEKNKAELIGWNVLVKGHPNQDRGKLNKIIRKHESFYMLPEGIDTNAIIFFADVVVGFFSSFLIEATIMNKIVLRFLDTAIKDDPFFELNIGTMVNRDTLIIELLKISQ